jgi:hypothetical protein
MSAAACTVRAQRPGPRPRRACRPCLTPLEDRVALSTLVVNSSADDGSTHTLRWAVENAQDGDTIQLTGPIKDPIVLTQGELLVTHDVTIQSVSSRTPTISGGSVVGHQSRVFEIAAGATVTLSNLKLINGNGDENPGVSDDDGEDGTGGAIINKGTLTVSDSILSGNTTAFGGGAIANLGNLTVSDSILSGNTANVGGAIYNFSGTAQRPTVTVIGSTLSGNVAHFGGGIWNNNLASTVIVGTTVFSQNTPNPIAGFNQDPQTGLVYTDAGGNTFN